MTETQIEKETQVSDNKKLVKKEPGDLIKKYLFPIAIATMVLYFVWIILDWAGHIINDGGSMFEGVRYVGIIVTILVLIVMGLFLAYTTFECFKFKKAMMKESLSTLIFNILVSFALLVLFLLVAVRVCQKSVWTTGGGSGTTYATSGRLMGATFVLLTYVTIYLATQMRTKKLNNNIQMIKAIIWTMTITITLSLFLMAFRIVGGFFSFEKIFEAEVFARLAAGAIRAGNIAITMFGLSTILVICIIPLLFLIEKNEELIKKQILISALIGGISLVLFVVTLAVMNENIIKFEQEKTGTTVCTVLLLVNFVATILFTVFSFINNKKFFGLYIDFNALKPKKKQPAVKSEEKETKVEDSLEQPSEEAKVEPSAPIVEEVKNEEPIEQHVEQPTEINEDELEVEVAQEVEETSEPIEENEVAQEVEEESEPIEEDEVVERRHFDAFPTVPTTDENESEQSEETVAPIVEKTIAPLVEETQHQEKVDQVDDQPTPFVVDEVKYQEQPQEEDSSQKETPIVGLQDIKLIEPEPITNPDLIKEDIQIKSEFTEENKKDDKDFKSYIDGNIVETNNISSNTTSEDNQNSTSESQNNEIKEENK